MAFVSVATYAMWCLASIGIAVEVVGLLLPWSLGLIGSADPLLSRTLFWYSGHAIVYFWLLPAYVSCFVMVPAHAGGKLITAFTLMYALEIGGMAVVQSWVYFVGVLIMARGLISGGLDGMPRRTLIMEAPYEKASWELAGLLIGFGGTLMFIGGGLFFAVLAATILFGKKVEGEQDIPFTVTHTTPATAGWEVRLDRFRYWIIAAVILILVAYLPFLIQYLPGNFTSPPYRFF